MKSLVTYILESRLSYQLGYKLAEENGMEIINSEEIKKYEAKNGYNEYDYILMPNIPDIIDSIKNVDVMGDKWIIVTCDVKHLVGYDRVENLIHTRSQRRSPRSQKVLMYKDIVKELKQNDDLKNELIKFIDDNNL